MARAVGLEVYLALYGMLEDLLMKARLGGVGQPVTSPFPAARSHSPNVNGSTMGDSVASRSAYALPLITEVEGSNIVVGENVLQKPCSSKQANARLAEGPTGSEKPGSFSIKTPQQIEQKEKKKQSRKWKWSREGRLNPLLPGGNDKGGYVFGERML